jgi:hypothetical protein
VDHIHDFNDVGVLKHPINNDEGQRRERQFAGSLHATDSAALREISEHAETVVNRPPDALRSRWIVQPNVVNDVLEIGRRVGRST